MSLPEELKEQIDDIKTPSNRVLVTCLILAIMALSGWCIWLVKGSNTNCKDDVSFWKEKYEKKSSEADSLMNDKIKTVTDENNRLKERDRWQDSIKSKIYNKLQ